MDSCSDTLPKSNVDGLSIVALVPKAHYRLFSTPHSHIQLKALFIISTHLCCFAPIKYHRRPNFPCYPKNHFRSLHTTANAVPQKKIQCQELRPILSSCCCQLMRIGRKIGALAEKCHPLFKHGYIRCDFHCRGW